MRPIAIRQDIQAKILRQAARTERNSGVCRRLLGIAHLLEGGSRADAQKIACLTVNTFRIWIQRFNTRGIEGLRAKQTSGRPSKLTAQIEQRLREKVLQGPSPKEGLARYRIVDLKNFLQEEYQISISLSGIWYILEGLNLTWKTGRQRHPQSNKDAQEAFKKTFQAS